MSRHSAFQRWEDLSTPQERDTLQPSVSLTDFHSYLLEAINDCIGVNASTSTTCTSITTCGANGFHELSDQA
ncbi:hypothetical protein ABTK30_19880, partial [Acinetobacter baumannii]